MEKRNKKRPSSRTPSRRRARVRTSKRKAKTSDIVGPTNQLAELSGVPRKHVPAYRRLMVLREQLLRRQVDLSKDAIEEQPAFSTHMADAGTDTFDRDLALSLLSSEQEAVYEIDQALDRIRNGTYGVCELTGKRIEPGRLEAIPWTRFSTEAEKSVEAQGGSPRAQLSRRENLRREPTATSEETE